MFNYYLTQCSSINTLPFIGDWEHFKIATFHMLLPELHLGTESIYFVCACKQVFISALHSCVQFIQIIKNICQVCQSCTTLITCKQLCVLGSSETLYVPLAAHTHGPAPCRATTIGPLHETARLYAPLIFSHTKPHICEFSQLVTLQSSPYAQHHPTQERGLRVKSWLRGLRGVKNSA